MNNLTISALFLLILVSCTTTKKIEELRQIDKGREPGAEFFAVKTNGEKIIATKITRPSVGNYTQTRIIVDGNKMEGTDLIAFQDAEGYYVWVSDPKPTKYWKGRFIKRVRRGKMNLYFYGTRSTYDNNDFYFFEKEKGRYERLTYESFSLALSDNQQALQEFRKLYPKGKILLQDIYGNSVKLASVVEIYNH